MLARPHAYPQAKIATLAKQLGYSNVNEGQLCAGICTSGVVSFYGLGSLEVFNKRIQVMCEDNNLVEKLQNIRNINTDEALFRLNLLAFIECILISNNPNDFRNILNTHIPQSENMRAESFFASTKNRQDGGLCVAKRWPGIYSLDEFKHYLSVLNNACIKHSTNVAFTFETATHRVLLCYQHDLKQWSYVDPDNLPAVTFKNINETANVIFSSMSDGQYAAFETMIYATKANLSAIATVSKDIEKSKAFHDLHKINKARSLAQTNTGVTLAYIAARNGHDDYIKPLKKKGANLELQCLNGWTPMHIAAQFNYERVIAALLKEKASVNQATAYGSLPLHVACQEDMPDAIDSLSQAKNIDLYTRNAAGFAPVQLAASLGNLNALRAILTNFPEFADDNNRANLIRLAEANNQRHIIDYLHDIKLVKARVINKEENHSAAFGLFSGKSNRMESLCAAHQKTPSPR